MTTSIRQSALVFCAVLAAPFCLAVNQTDEEPRIALVLSGGGARGVAHVGVLRVLEELQIAPDLVVGTSMGSIVGGLYAAGWSPDQIEDLVQAIDWEKVFTDRLDRRDRSFRRKLDDYPLMIQGRLHFEGTTLVLPSGVIDGQRLELMLRIIQAQSPSYTDFDDLPIPFRAVAADIATGEAVILDSGSLATAIRASMSVPGALPPVHLDGRELVDGGIAANLPVGIARELGATSIIAVDISSPLITDPSQFDSFLSVYNHLNSLLTAGNRDRDVERLERSDVLIVPDLGDISFVSFDRTQEAIAIGEEAARLQIDELRAFSGTEKRWASFSQRPRARPTEPIEVDRVRLENTSHVDDRLIRRALSLDPPSAVDRKELGFDMLKLYNTRFFGVIDFSIDKHEAGAHELIVHTPPPPHGKGSLQFGLGFIDDFDGNSSYHILARHQYLPANRRGGEWETLVGLGTVAGASTSFYQPLDWGRNWFIEPSLTYERGVQDLWLDGTAIAEYQFRTFDARLAAGRVLGRWGEIRLAAFTGENRGSPRIGDPDFQSISQGRGGAEARFRIDTESSVVFPQHGAAVDLTYTVTSESFGSEFDQQQVWGSASHAWTFAKNTIVPALEYGENLDPIQSYFQAFFLGGLFRLSGLANKELFGEKVALARVLAYRRLFGFDVAGARIRIYAGFSLEAGNVYFAGDDVSWGTMRKGGSVFIGGETFVGPVIFAYGRIHGGRDRFYLGIGDLF